MTRFLRGFYVLFEWEYFFHLMKYCWFFLVNIFFTVYNFSSSNLKWNVFCISVLKLADFNNNISNIEKTLIFLNKLSSWVLNSLIFLMKNEWIFTWFNFLLDFFVLRFFVNKYTLFFFFSRDVIFLFLLIYFKKCCCARFAIFLSIFLLHQLILLTV